MKWNLFAIVCLSFVISCSSTPDQQETDIRIYDLTEQSNKESIDLSLMLAQQRAMDRIGQEPTSVNREVQQTKEYKTENKPEVKHKYVLKTKNNHPKVQKWINYYSQKDRERFQRFLNRGAKYKQIVQDLFVANGLPPDLYYLGILESGYVQGAVSRVGAVGPWQFMGPTGREYGLKINNYVDERVDIIRSTLAASRYLKELFRQKKSWYLALAAYNAGPGRVRRAMRKARRRGKAQNYWSLTRRRLLPYDTREYIPQFLAILYIGKNLEKFNFVEQTHQRLPYMELVKVPSPVKLNQISKSSGIDVDELKKLNPQLTQEMTPPGKNDYHIWIKKEDVKKVVGQYSSLASHRIKGLKVRRVLAKYKGRRRIHRVRRGQSLSSIARRYGLSLYQLKKLNKLKSNRIYVGQRLKVRSGRLGQTRVNRKTAYHKVRKGQNLTLIAKRYGMSVKQLRRLNRMQRSRLYVGQKLKVYSRKSRKLVLKKNYHLVKSGENLTSVAKQYGLSVKDLKAFNKLKRSRILKGQKLRLIASKGKPKRYKIKRGDNLFKIAKKFGLTVKQIKKINKLKTNNIKRGQYLIIAGN